MAFRNSTINHSDHARHNPVSCCVRRFPRAFPMPHQIIKSLLSISCIFLFAAWGWPWEVDRERERAERAEWQLQDAKRQSSGLGVLLVIVIIVGGGIFWYLYSHRTVIKNVVQKQVVQKVVRQVVVVRSPAHSINHESYCIDGLNVIRSFSPYQPPSLQILLTLLVALRARGWTFKCFFDNNTFHVFRDAKLHPQARLYTDLCREFPDSFVEVPTRNRADDYILDYAHTHGTPIISNDLFRDYIATYPWIETDSARRISGVCHSDIVQIYPLGIQAPLLSDLATAVSSLRESLSKRDTQNA